MWAAVSIGDWGSGVEARWEIEESTDANFNVSNQQSGVLFGPGVLSLGTEYTISVSYDGANGFEFVVDGNSSGIQSGPARAGESPNRYFDLTNGLNFVAGGDGVAASSVGTFDNVYLNGSATLYDDFASGAIDPAKWTFPRMRRGDR
ncbi:MAG: hypothetical protein M5U09_19765 [Gammaproteobacteria bacterium]|nr:hypothetical protein [Gammaproteobacteria bacterium]